MPINLDQTHLLLMVLLPLLLTFSGTVRVLYAIARGRNPRVVISEVIYVTIAFIVLTALTLLSWQLSYSSHELMPVFDSPISILIVGLAVLLTWNVVIALLWHLHMRSISAEYDRHERATRTHATVQSVRGRQ